MTSDRRPTQPPARFTVQPSFFEQSITRSQWSPWNRVRRPSWFRPRHTLCAVVSPAPQSRRVQRQAAKNGHRLIATALGFAANATVPSPPVQPRLVGGRGIQPWACGMWGTCGHLRSKTPARRCLAAHVHTDLPPRPLPWRTSTRSRRAPRPQAPLVRQCDESDAGHRPGEACIVIDPSASMA